MSDWKERDSLLKNSTNLKISTTNKRKKEQQSSIGKNLLDENEYSISVDSYSNKKQNNKSVQQPQQMSGIKNIHSKVHNNFPTKLYVQKQLQMEGLGLELPAYSDDNMTQDGDQNYTVKNYQKNMSLNKSKIINNSKINRSKTTNIINKNHQFKLNSVPGSIIISRESYNRYVKENELPEARLLSEDYSNRLRFEMLKKSRLEAMCHWKRNDAVGLNKNNYIKEIQFKNESILTKSNKDDLEKLDVYTDRYPLLGIRKSIMRFIILFQIIAYNIITSSIFGNFTLIVIISNSLFMMMDDPLRTTSSPIFDTADSIFLYIYISEMALKIIGLGLLSPNFESPAYLQDAWNLLDGGIVIASIVTAFGLPSSYVDTLPTETGKTVLSGNQLTVSSLRVLRVLRPLRTVSSVKGLKILMQALFSAVPLLIDTLTVLMFYFIIGAIAGQQIFTGILKQHCVQLETGIVIADYSQGGNDGLCGGFGSCPDGFICAKANIGPNYGVSSFDNILWGMLNYYYAITLEGWTEQQKQLQYTITFWIWLFWTPFILSGAFFLVNLFLAVLSSKFSEATSEQDKIDKMTKSSNGVDIEKQQAEQQELNQFLAKKDQMTIAQFITARIYAKKMIEFVRNRREIKRIQEEKLQRIKQKQILYQQAKRTVESNSQQTQPNGSSNNTSEGILKKKQIQNINNNIITEEEGENQDDQSDNSQKHLKEVQNLVKIGKSHIQKQGQNSQDIQIPKVIKYSNQNYHNLEIQSNGFLDGPKMKGNIGQTKKNLFINQGALTTKQKKIFSKLAEELDIDKIIPQNQQIKNGEQNQNDYGGEDILKLSESLHLSNYNEMNSMSGSLNGKGKQNGQNKIELDSNLITSDSDFEIAAYAAGYKNKQNESPQKKQKEDIKKDISQTFKRMLTQNHHRTGSQHNFNNGSVHGESTKYDANSNNKSEIPEIEEKFARKKKNMQSQKKIGKIYKEDEQFLKGLDEENENNEKGNKLLNILKSKEDIQHLEEFISSKRPRDFFKNLDPLNQKVIINLDKQYFGASKTDIFQKRIELEQFKNRQDKNPLLQMPLHLQEIQDPDYADQLFIKTIHDPYQQKTVYNVQKNSDEEDNSSSLDEDEIVALEQPFQTYTRIQYQDMIKQLHLNEIFKRSDIVITSTLSINLFPKDNRKINEKNFSQMDQTLLNEFIDEKNSFNALEKSHFYKYGMDKEKDEEYRKSYSKSYIHRSRFATQTFKKFKIQVSELNMNRKHEKKKGNEVMKAERTKYEQNKRSSQKKGLPVFDLTMANKLLDGKFHDDDDEEIEEKKLENIQQELQYYQTNVQLILNQKEENETVKIIDEIPEDLRKELNIPESLGIMEINNIQVRKYDASKKRKTPTWSGQDVLQDSINIEQSQQIIDQLNQIRVWPTGFHTILKRLRVLIRMKVRHPIFDYLFTFIVVCNTVTLSLDSYGASIELQSTLETLGNYFTYIFIYELGSKVFALGPKKYLQDDMNKLDGGVVMMSIFEIIYTQAVSSGGGSSLKTFKTLKMLRTLRVFRILRLLRKLKSMQTILQVMTKSYSSFIYITMLLFLFILIFALLGSQFFAGIFDNFPWYGTELSKQNYDTIEFAVMTCFNIMQGENWNNIIIQIAWAAPDLTTLYVGMVYLVIWFFIGNYIMLNLFLSILLDAFFDDAAEEEDEDFARQKRIEKKLRIAEKKRRKDKNKVFINKKALLGKQLKKKGDIFDEYEDLEDLDEEQMANIFKSEGFMIKSEEEQKENVKLYQDVDCGQSLYLFPKYSLFRDSCYKLYKNKYFDNLILAFILLSSFKLATDSYNYRFDPEGEYIYIMSVVSDIFNYVFTFEMSIKIVSLGFVMDKGSYLRESWNILDFGIVSSSLLEMSLQSINIPFIRILRLLRVLRPLRFISHNKDLKLIVVALLESVNAIFNVAMVIAVVFLIFAIVGVSLQGGKYFRCTNDSLNISNMEACLKTGGDWYDYQANFDNVANAILSLYIISNGEGWPNNLTVWMDSQDVDLGPSNNYSALEAIIFYIIFIMVGQFFFINFFIGVLFMKFEEARIQEEKGYTQQDLNWVDIQRLILLADPDYDSTNYPKNPFRQGFHKFVTSKEFDIGIVFVILLNVLTMAMEHEGMSIMWVLIIKNLSYVFTVIFIMEMMLKMIAFGATYFDNSWNKFDFFVVNAAIFDIVLNNINASALSVISFAPSLAKVMRVLRVTRIIKLASKAKGLQAIIETISFAITPLSNVAMLVLLVYYMFSILGNAIFNGVTNGDILDPYYKNWNDWHHSFIVSFVFSTGEDWPKAMFQCSLNQTDGCIMGQTCGSHFSFLFYMMLTLCLDYIFLSLFEIVIIGQFEKYYLPKDNMINNFKIDLKIFMDVWKQFTQFKYNCFKIKENQIIKFFRELGQEGTKETSLGFHEDFYTDGEVKKMLLKMGIKSDNGYIYFNQMLYRCMKLKYGNMKINKNMQIIELRTQYFILLKTLQIQSKGSNLRNEDIYNSIIKKENGVNPFLTIMNLKISLKTWIKHAKNIYNLREREPKSYQEALREISHSIGIEYQKKNYHKVEIEIEETLYITSDEEDQDDDAESISKQNTIVKKMKTKLGQAFIKNSKGSKVSQESSPNKKQSVDFFKKQMTKKFSIQSKLSIQSSKQDIMKKFATNLNSKIQIQKL